MINQCTCTSCILGCNDFFLAWVVQLPSLTCTWCFFAGGQQEEELSRQYDAMLSTWLRKLEQVENSPKRKYVLLISFWKKYSFSRTFKSIASHYLSTIYVVCRSKELKAREVFEKYFPELRRQREQNERVNRCVRWLLRTDLHRWCVCKAEPHWPAPVVCA